VFVFFESSLAGSHEAENKHPKPFFDLSLHAFAEELIASTQKVKMIAFVAFLFHLPNFILCVET